MPSRVKLNREIDFTLLTSLNHLNSDRLNEHAPKPAAPFWACHMQKMISLGIHDRRWILFALDDIATFCSSNGMKLSSHAIETAIHDLEETVLANK